MIGQQSVRNLVKMRNFSQISTRNFTRGKIIYNKQGGGGSVSAAPTGNVAGLSERVLKVPNEPVGPGAAKNSDYKNPEYFCYDKNSYFEAEIEMLKYRCPQPSASVYYKQPGSEK